MNFWKMSGAGNDFIMVDDRNGDLESLLTTEFISSICRRGLSVGADGLIRLLPSKGSAFRMKYYNSDGGEAEMCGNGARCICRFACLFDLVETGSEFLFESQAGLHRGLVTGNSESRIWMTEPEVHWLNRPIRSMEGLEVSYLNTGVPHAVVVSDDLEDGTFEALSPLLRKAPEFGDSGANADWLRILNDGTLMMRTWERGVEGETLACGTGAVACAVVASSLPYATPLPVRIRVRSGRELMVGHDSNGWWLQGESRFIYRGVLLDHE